MFILYQKCLFRWPIYIKSYIYLHFSGSDCFIPLGRFCFRDDTDHGYYRSFIKLQNLETLAENYEIHS